jgi:peptide/nickel transport system substrate-binding protein
MSKRRWSAALSVVLLVALFVAACGPTPEPVTEIVTQVVEVEKEVTRVVEGTPMVETIVETQVVEKEVTTVVEVEKVVTAEAAGPKRGGSMTWAEGVIPMKLDPVWTQARADNFVLSNILEGLTVGSDDGEGIEPSLAESWEISDDGLVYTFHLRQGVKFHNGKDLTPEDVIASLQRAKDMGVWKWSLEEIEQMEAVDDSTVEITLSKPVAAFLGRLAIFANAIFPAEEIAAIGEDEFTEPIGTGPFMIGEWVRNERLTVEKNPDYWRLGEDGEPLPYLDEIVFVQVPEPTTRVLQVQSGDAHGTTSIPFSQIAPLKADPRGQMNLFPVQQIYFMVVKADIPPFDDIKVRQAMSLALDRQVFVDRVTDGEAVPANSFFPKTQLCWNEDAELPYDLEQAKQLMAESNYPDGYEDLKIEVSGGSQIGRDNAVIAQEAWAEIGLDFVIEEVESSALGDRWYNADYQVISGYQWTTGQVDPELHVRFFIVEPRMNSGWEGNERATELAEAANEELDSDVRCDMFKEIQEIYNEEHGGTISLFYTPNVCYLSNDLQGYAMTPLSRPLFYRAWLDD